MRSSGHWGPLPLQPAPPPLPNNVLFEKILAKIQELDAQLCERCRAKVLDPLCPSCFEMIRCEIEAGWD